VDLDDVVAPADSLSLQPQQPVACTLLDQALFVAIDSFRWAVHGIVASAGFHLHEAEGIPLTADNVDLPAKDGAMVALQDFAALLLKPLASDTLADATDLGGGPWLVTEWRSKRSAERLGRTNGDESGRVRDEPALQDDGQSGNLCEHRIHKLGSAGRAAS
jgi:hypothetical protein